MLEDLCTWVADAVCKDNVEQHQRMAVALLLDRDHGLPAMLAAVAAAPTAKTGTLPCSHRAATLNTPCAAPAYFMAKAVEELLRSMLNNLPEPQLVAAAPQLVATANMLYGQPYRDITLKRGALALLRSIVLLPGVQDAHPQLFDARQGLLHTTATFRVVRGICDMPHHGVAPIACLLGGIGVERHQNNHQGRHPGLPRRTGFCRARGLTWHAATQRSLPVHLPPAKHVLLSQCLS